MSISPHIMFTLATVLVFSPLAATLRIVHPDGTAVHNDWWTEDPIQLSKLQGLPECCYRQTNYQFCSRDVKSFPRYIGPGHEESSPATADLLFDTMKGRKVVLMGDSTTRQWFDSLACFTGAKFSGWNSTTNKAEAAAQSKKISDFNGGKIGNLFSGGPGFVRLSFPDHNMEILTYIVNALTLDEKHKIISYHTEKDAADAIVMNEGVHYNDGDEEKLKKVYTAEMEYCKATAAKCIFRETSPQHWQRATWNFIKPNLPMKHTNEAYQSELHKINSMICETHEQCKVDEYPNRANWRNLLLRSVAEPLAIPVMPLFDDLAAMAWAHPNGDGTHWHANAEVWEPWQLRLVETLRKFWKQDESK